jgi:hypothetical protein
VQCYYSCPVFEYHTRACVTYIFKHNIYRRTRVTQTATDSSGNVGICEFNVDVLNPVYCVLRASVGDFQTRFGGTLFETAMEQALDEEGGTGADTHVILGELEQLDGGRLKIDLGVYRKNEDDLVDETFGGLTGPDLSQDSFIKRLVSILSEETGNEINVFEVSYCSTVKPSFSVTAPVGDEGVGSSGDENVAVPGSIGIDENGNVIDGQTEAPDICADAESSLCPKTTPFCQVIPTTPDYRCTETKEPQYQANVLSVSGVCVASLDCSLVIFGQRLHTASLVLVNGKITPFKSKKVGDEPARRLLAPGDEIQELEVLVGVVNQTGYQTMSIALEPYDEEDVYLLTWPASVFVADNDGCSSVGLWLDENEECQQCQAGAECPGGGRQWPLSGYWSTGEHSQVLECRVPTACLGRDVLTGRTDACASAYEGDICDACASNHYPLNGQCFSCDAGSSAEKAELALRLLGIVGTQCRACARV